MAGNQNSGPKKQKPWLKALMMEVLTPAGQKKLRVAARNLLDQAANGDLQAMRDLRDTLDGRPVQQIESESMATQSVFVLPAAPTKDPDLEEWVGKHKPPDSNATQH